MAAPMKIRVLELYSGVGGMHYALAGSGMEYEVVIAIDVNTSANLVYNLNFPDTTPSSSSIESLTVKKFDSLDIDMILMSPPCQPFTRVGKQKDTEDVRTKSFLHVLQLLKSCKKCPSYILLENVKGFECSQARDMLVETLNKCAYIYQELLLTPLQFGIPNSRLRYFLIAKKQPVKFSFKHSDQIMEQLPDCPSNWYPYRMRAHSENQSDIQKDPSQKCVCLGNGSSNMSEKLHTKDHNELHTNDEMKDTSQNNSCQKKTCTDNDSTKSDGCSPKRRKIEQVSKLDSTNSDKKLENNGIDKTLETEPTRLNDTHSIIDNGTASADIKAPPGDCDTLSSVSSCLKNYGQNYRQSVTEIETNLNKCLKLHHFLEENFHEVELFSDYLVPEKEYKRFLVMDIVNPCSTKTCCFTKRYGHYIDGAGSLVQMTSDHKVMMKASQLKDDTIARQDRDQWGEAELSIIRDLKLRYFTPREIANILCFPSAFRFPASLTNRQLYMLLGNSLNVHVVTVLIKLMMLGD